MRGKGSVLDRGMSVRKRERERHIRGLERYREREKCVMVIERHREVGRNGI